MKAVILAVSLFLLLSCSVASGQPTKITVGYTILRHHCGPISGYTDKMAAFRRINILDKILATGK